MRLRIKKVTGSNNSITPYYVPQVKEHWWSLTWNCLNPHGYITLTEQPFASDKSAMVALECYRNRNLTEQTEQVEYFDYPEEKFKMLKNEWFAPTEENMLLFEKDDVFLVSDGTDYGQIDIAQYKDGKWVKYTGLGEAIKFTPETIKLIWKFKECSEFI